MHTILFFFQRFFIFLADVVLVPTRGLISLWHSPRRGRAILFGLPAFIMAGIVLSTVVWAWLGSNSGITKRYELLAERAEQDAVEAQMNSDEDKLLASLQTAEVYWTKLRNMHPTNNDYLYGLFSVAIKRNDKDTANEILNQLAPNDRAVHLESHLFKAELLLRDPRTQSSVTKLQLAQQQLELALRLKPDLEEAKLRLADVYYYRGDKNRAFDIFEEYYRKYPVFIFKMYTILKEQDRTDEVDNYVKLAIDSYEEKLEDYPDNIGLWERYARCYVLLKRFDKAKDLLVKQKKEAGTEKQAKFDELISQLYSLWAMSINEESRVSGEPNNFQLNQYLEKLQEGLRHNNNNRRILYQLTVLGNSNFPQSVKARELYDPRINPESANVAELLAAGSHEVTEGDVKLGIDLLEVALQKEPKNPIVANNLAFSIRLSDPKRALEMINNALKSAPNSSRFLDTRGHIYMVQREFAKAAADFEKAENDPRLRNSIDIHRALAICYRQLKLDRSAEVREAKVRELESLQSGSLPQNENSGRLIEGNIQRSDSPESDLQGNDRIDNNDGSNL